MYCYVNLQLNGHGHMDGGADGFDLVDIRREASYDDGFSEPEWHGFLGMGVDIDHARTT